MTPRRADIAITSTWTSVEIASCAHPFPGMLGRPDDEGHEREDEGRDEEVRSKSMKTPPQCARFDAMIPVIKPAPPVCVGHSSVFMRWA